MKMIPQPILGDELFPCNSKRMFKGEMMFIILMQLKIRVGIGQYRYDATVRDLCAKEECHIHLLPQTT